MLDNASKNKELSDLGIIIDSSDQAGNTLFVRRNLQINTNNNSRDLIGNFDKSCSVEKFI